MFYRLKSEFMLRGWKLLPTGVINRKTRDFKFLPENKFAVLKLCNGLLNSESVLFNDEQRKIMKELHADGYVDEKSEISPLEDVQAYKFYDNRFMHSMRWSITGKCNCKCRHCYMSAPQHKIEEFTHEECMNIIAQMAECGIQQVSLTGGELLVRKDFWEIVDALIDADVKIAMMYSNGFLINEKFIAALDKRNLRPIFQISFDGVNGCHDWLRGVEGAEKLTLRAIRLLHEKNLPVDCAYALHRGNMDVFRDTVKTLAKAGADYMRVSTIVTQGEAVEMRDKILTPEEIFNFHLSYIPQYIEDGAPLAVNLTSVFESFNTTEYRIPFAKMSEDIPSDNYCVCGHVRNSMHIDFDGYIMPCPPMSFGDNGKKLFPRITDKKLSELLVDKAYMNFISTRLKDYFKANPQCSACKYKNRCAGGCRGLAMAENRDGNLLGVDKSTCKFFKGGYYDKVIALAEKLNLKRIGA